MPHHAVGGEVLVLGLEVEGVLVILAHLGQTLCEQLLAVCDPL